MLAYVVEACVEGRYALRAVARLETADLLLGRRHRIGTQVVVMAELVAAVVGCVVSFRRNRLAIRLVRRYRFAEWIDAKLLLWLLWLLLWLLIAETELRLVDAELTGCLIDAGVYTVSRVAGLETAHLLLSRRHRIGAQVVVMAELVAAVVRRVVNFRRNRLAVRLVGRYRILAVKGLHITYRLVRLLEPLVLGNALGSCTEGRRTEVVAEVVIHAL